MDTLLRVLTIGFVLGAGLASVARADDQAATAAPAASELKKGDAVYVCGCGEACKCGSIAAAPGKCGCGQPLVKATVAKIDGGLITVDRAGGKGETTFKAPYKCACGPKCTCNAVALGPAKCHCGMEMVKAN